MFNVRCSLPICPLCSGPGRFFYTDPKRHWHYHQCGDCELIWMDSAGYPTRDEEHAHYSQHDNRPDDPNYRAFLGKLWQPLKSELKPGAVGLDYGSGPGPTLHLMAKEDGFECTHYDPFFQMDDSVFENQYDFITCTETAEHFQKPAKEFERLARLLKPDGILGVMSSIYNSSIDFAEWHYRKDPTHIVFFSRKSFQALTERCGLKLLYCDDQSVALFSK